MRADFSRVKDERNFVAVPAGTYYCKVADVRPGRARDGSERWGLRLEVVGGDWSGKTAAWDSITWSERGIYRVKCVLESFGFDVSGELEVEPRELLGRTAHVEVQLEEWEDPEAGRRHVRTAVPFLGYAKANGERDPGLLNGAATGSTNGSTNGNGSRGDHGEVFDPFAED